MAGVDVVAAVHVLLVDGETAAGHQLDHALHDQDELEDENNVVNSYTAGQRFLGTYCGVVRLRHARVVTVGLGQHGDVHRDGAVVIVDSADEEDAAEDDESGIKGAISGHL